MIKVKKNKLVEAFFYWWTHRTLGKLFAAHHVRGMENIKQLNPNIPVVFYANHSNWWDGLLCFYFTYKIFRIDTMLMMDILQLRKHPFFKWIGAFSVDRENKRKALESIRYCISELASKRREALWIYPQGVMLPNDTRPICFYPGIAHIIKGLKQVQLVSVVHRYEFIKEQRPEIFTHFSPIELIDNTQSIDSEIVTERMQQQLLLNLEALKEDVITLRLSDFTTLQQGQKSISQSYDFSSSKNNSVAETTPKG